MDYSKCVTTDGKSYAAIEKIIARMAYKDFRAMNPPGRKGKLRPYSLSCDTLEALEIKKDYLSGNITEEEYKAYCLKKNLIHSE